MITVEEYFRYYLKEKGLKFTPEREEILETVFSLHKHFDVEELYDILRARGKNISRATIYRTIPLLKESHLIQETLHCTGNTKYEHIYGHEHHDHLICVECGRFIEAMNPQIEKLQKKLANDHGFTLLRHKMHLFGMCKKCRGKSGRK